MSLILPSGGSILTELIERNSEDRYVLSALVRKSYQASILADAGVSPLIFKDLDDFDVIREAAKDNDSTSRFPEQSLLYRAYSVKSSLQPHQQGI